MPTMRDVASEAGVSAKTVSRVFNDDPHVTPHTRERVEAAMRKLNYVPNVLATTFRAGRTTVIGVAVPDILDPFFAAIAHAVEEQAGLRGMSTLITSLGADPERERPILESLLSRQLSGLIIAPVGAEHGWLRRWRGHTPLVFVDRLPTGLAADSYTEDDISGSALATTHLVSHGHTRIAFFGDQLDVPSTERRLRGYREGLERSGLAFDPYVVVRDVIDRESAELALTRLWRLPQRPTAVYSSNARTTMAAVPGLARRRLALVGMGDFPMADALTPAVSVIAQDPQRLGRLAANRALDRLALERARPVKRVLPVYLIERDSCRAAARGRGAPRRAS